MNAHAPPGTLDATAMALMQRLRTLHDEEALGAVVAHRPLLTEPLRFMLFEREPSGIYQPRCRAATALGRIGAYDALLDFLDHPRAVDDPVERSGEDAVVNASAQAAARSGRDDVFQRLMRIASDKPHLIGVVEALGSYRRTESIPALVGALIEDGSRHAAEQALATIGDPAIPALVDAALAGPPAGALEYSIPGRKRRSALKVLTEIGIQKRTWKCLRPLMADTDKWISTFACELALSVGSWGEQEEALERLEAMRRTADIWLLFHIDDLLASADHVRAEPRDPA